MAKESPAKEAQHAARQASTESRRAAEAARDEMQGMTHEAAGRMDAARERVRDAADERVRATTATGADKVERTARAFEDAAGEYREGSTPSEALHRVSGFLEETAHDLRNADLETVTGEVRRFARRNPALFVAGAAAVGFAAARLLRAGDPDMRDGDGRRESDTSERPATEGSGGAAGSPAATAPGAPGGDA